MERSLSYSHYFCELPHIIATLEANISESVSCSVMSDSATLWVVACQAPLSMEFSRQEYWSGLPFPSPGNLSIPRIEPGSPTLQADTLPSEPPGKPIATDIFCA